MANLNKVMLIGRLTFDPEPTQNNPNGATFRFAVNNRKQNKQTQQWEDAPCYLEVVIWNRGENKQAERVLQTLRAGAQIYLEGHLQYDEWDDRNGGGKRSKVVVVAETFQYLDSKEESERRLASPARPRPKQGLQATGQQQQPYQRQPAAAPKSYSNEYDDAPMGATAASGGGGKGDDNDIPF